VVLGLPVLAAIVLGLLLGGRIEQLAELRFRAGWLLGLAIVLQVLAFPFGFLPWHTSSGVASALWLASYVLLLAAAVLNVRLPGVPVVAAGMAANALAVAANGGTMPVLPRALEAAGYSYTTLLNSTAVAEPRIPWLVDRWAAPGWVPLANVFSVGDVLIAVGVVVIVLGGMGVRLPRPARSRDAGF